VPRPVRTVYWATMPLRRLTARLRRDCPWDREQTLHSMRPYLLEEAYEVLSALDAGDATNLREELGDLLFQIYFLAQIASESSAAPFTIDDVAESAVRKMIERHPHVFAPGTRATDVLVAVVPTLEPDFTASAAPVSVNAEARASDLAAWEARKAASRPSNASRVDGVPKSLPALLRAHRVGEKLAHVGFDWPDVQGVLDKIEEERGELAEAMTSGDRAAVVHEYGDLLLACASLGRFLGVPGEDALRQANLRFEGRFRLVERMAGEDGVSLEHAGPERLDGYWRRAKALEEKALEQRVSSASIAATAGQTE